MLPPLPLRTKFLAQEKPSPAPVPPAWGVWVVCDQALDWTDSGKRESGNPGPTHVASEQMFLWPQKGRRTVAKALPWLNISVTWEGR